jgi:chromosome segregation ATPase
MDNSKFVNYYIETLVSTLNDAILKNISYQANSRISEEVVDDLENKLDQSNKNIESLKNDLESTRQSKSNDENNRINSLENTIHEQMNTINRLDNEISQLNHIKNEYENTKNNLTHLESFKKQLIESREENERLKNEIEFLNLTPAKRKKIEEAKIKEVQINTLDKNNTKDGGSF